MRNRLDEKRGVEKKDWRGFLSAVILTLLYNMPYLRLNLLISLYSIDLYSLQKCMVYSRQKRQKTNGHNPQQMRKYIHKLLLPLLNHHTHFPSLRLNV